MSKIVVCGVAKNMQHGLNEIKKMGLDLIILEDRDLRQDKEDTQYILDIKSKNFFKKAMGLLKKHKKEIEGIINLGRNPAILPSVKIAQALSLPLNSIKSAEISMDKYKQAKLFGKKGLCSNTMKSSTFLDVEKFAKNVGYPLVIKPTNLSAAIGVRKIRSKEEIQIAIDYCQDNKRSFGKLDKSFLVQKFENGTEHSAEAVIYNGKIFHTGFSDRVYAYEEYDPFFVERGDVLPTFLEKDQKQALIQVFEEAAELIGADNCAIKADLIQTKAGPKIIELHTRLGSPNFWELNNLSTGTNSLRALVNVCMGKNPEKYCKPKINETGVMFECILPKPGFFKKLSGLEELKKIQGFNKFSWWEKELKEGELISEIDNLSKMIAYVITIGNSRNIAIECMQKCMAKIKLEVENEPIIP